MFILIYFILLRRILYCCVMVNDESRPISVYISDKCKISLNNAIFCVKYNPGQGNHNHSYQCFYCPLKEEMPANLGSLRLVPALLVLCGMSAATAAPPCRLSHAGRWRCRCQHYNGHHRPTLSFAASPAVLAHWRPMWHTAA